jgi:hypothetical protein
MCSDQGNVVAVEKVKGRGDCVGRAAPANGFQSLQFQMDTDFFYWVDRACGTRESVRRVGAIKAVPRRAGPAIIIATREAHAQDLRVGPGGLYWRTTEGVRFAGRPHFASPTTLVKGEITALVVKGSTIFFTRPDGVYSLSGDRVHRLARRDNPRHLVADDRYLYWLSPNTHEILRVAQPR